MSCHSYFFSIKKNKKLSKKFIIFKLNCKNKMAQYKTRDPHNPYRTGVLVGNYVEDKFGAEFAVQEVSEEGGDFEGGRPLESPLIRIGPCATSPRIYFHSFSNCNLHVTFLSAYRKSTARALVKIRLSSTRATPCCTTTFPSAPSRTCLTRRSTRTSRIMWSSTSAASPTTS